MNSFNESAETILHQCKMSIKILFEPSFSIVVSMFKLFRVYVMFLIFVGPNMTHSMNPFIASKSHFDLYTLQVKNLLLEFDGFFFSLTLDHD